MATYTSGFSYLRNSMLPSCLTFWTDQKWGHSSHRNWPIILLCINTGSESSPKSHWDENRQPVEFLCPANRPQPPGHTHGPQGLPDTRPPPPFSSLTPLILSISSNAVSWITEYQFATHNREGKVGLPGEQSLEEVFLKIKHCSHAHKRLTESTRTHRTKQVLIHPLFLPHLTLLAKLSKHPRVLLNIYLDKNFVIFCTLKTDRTMTHILRYM